MEEGALGGAIGVVDRDSIPTLGDKARYRFLGQRCRSHLDRRRPLAPQVKKMRLAASRRPVQHQRSRRPIGPPVDPTHGLGVAVRHEEIPSEPFQLYTDLIDAEVEDDVARDLIFKLRRNASPKQITDRYPDVHPLFFRLICKTFVKDPNTRFPTDEASKEEPTGFVELLRTLEVCRKTHRGNP